jgi:hypothetical protein
MVITNKFAARLAIQREFAWIAAVIELTLIRLPKDPTVMYPA